MHRRHTQNLAPLLPPQLGAHHPVYPRSDRLATFVDQHTGIVVKAYTAAVPALDLVLCADHNGMANVTAFHFGGGGRGTHAALARGGALLLDNADNAVADGGVALLANNHGALDNGGAAVVDAVEHCLQRREGSGLARRPLGHRMRWEDGMG